MAYRELDETFRLTEIAQDALQDNRVGRNTVGAAACYNGRHSELGLVSGSVQMGNVG
jgi:hypothetical protein